jgi:hypothetical protein
VDVKSKLLLGAAISIIEQNPFPLSILCLLCMTVPILLWIFLFYSHKICIIDMIFYFMIWISLVSTHKQPIPFVCFIFCFIKAGGTVPSLACVLLS